MSLLKKKIQLVFSKIFKKNQIKVLIKKPKPIKI